MKTVMVIDDSRFVCEEIVRQLADTEFDVLACYRDAEEGMQAYAKHNPDVVIMDIVLPGIDGIEATKSLLARYPRACIVMASSLAYDEAVDTARQIGARSFLFKPVDREKLLEVLRAVV